MLGPEAGRRETAPEPKRMANMILNHLLFSPYSVKGPDASQDSSLASQSFLFFVEDTE